MQTPIVPKFSQYTTIISLSYFYFSSREIDYKMFISKLYGFWNYDILIIKRRSPKRASFYYLTYTYIYRQIICVWKNSLYSPIVENIPLFSCITDSKLGFVTTTTG